MRISLLLSALVIFTFTAGCGDDDPSTPDGSAGDSSLPDATPDADPGDADPGDADPEDAGRPDAVIDGAPLGPCTEAGAPCEGGFCRPTEAGGLECHPWRMEGDRCGGFTAAWDQERCDPSLICINFSPRLPDASGVCGIVATAAEVIAAPGDYEGRTTGILSAYLYGGTPICTEIGCPPRDPCCNGCNSTMTIHESAPRAGEAGIPAYKADGPLTCMGVSGRSDAMCNPYEMCTDMIEPNRTHVMVGSVVRAAEGERFVIEYGPNPTFP